MKHALILAALLCTGAQARECQMENPIGGNDLLKNVVGSAVAGSAITAATGSPAWGIAATSTFAVLKELSDRNRTNHRCSLSDLIQKIGGGVAGSLGTKWLILPAVGGGVMVAYATEF